MPLAKKRSRYRSAVTCSPRKQNPGGVSKIDKKAISSLPGLSASANYMVRTGKLPKISREDYTALSLA